MAGTQRLALALFAAAFAGAPFTDISARAGFTQPVIYGPADHKDYILEATGCGLALIDFDEDGWLDVFVLSGTRFNSTAGSNRLYRNQRNGTFAEMDVGLRKTGWPSSVTAGDFNGDGHLDLFVTYWGQNVLYRWSGGRFVDATREAGLSSEGRRWSSGAAFFDYDRDGHLDLFVTEYLEFDPARVAKPGDAGHCNWKGVAVNCGPRGLPKGRHHLYRNRGDGTFEDVSARTGIGAAPAAYAMTAVAADYNEDGWVDLYVACDSSPSLLFVNQRDGTFAEQALERGVAVSSDGMEQAGMGVALGDVNRDGHLDIFKTNFADDTHNLYVNSGDGHFADRGAALLAGDQRHMGWGASLQDFDNDGWPDVFYVTGNVFPEAERKLPHYPHLGPRMLFRSLAGRSFARVPLSLPPQSSRGAAFGDIDNDGDIDTVILNMNAAPTLLRNDWAPRTNHWLSVDLGARSTGATVIASFGGRRTAGAVTSQESFYSVNDARLHFGLGEATQANIEVRWPNGRVTQHPALAAGRVHRLRAL